MKRRLLLCFALLLLTPSLRAQDVSSYDPFLKNLPWRSIGPAIMGGRIDDFAVVESSPGIVYVGTATGGVFKSLNKGTTWEPVFDDQTVSSIGAVAVAPSNPNIVWVGTGEANNRQSSSWGNGVYKSTDAGKTWTNMGLEKTMHIGRVVIHPQNPDIVYVAAGGNLWGPSKERGLYGTTDGGKTWTNALFIDENTGFTDVAIDRQDPNILYAAAYQRRRTAFGFNGGGPGSGLYKTTDGGKTWKKLTNGLPTGDTGRIGLDIYRKDPKIVYACIENANGGVFRSEDRGETWKKMGSVNQSMFAFRPMYFSQIRVDPNDDQRLWMGGVRMGISTDGGKTFRTELGGRIHADVHAIWIDPANSDQMLVGCDGGMQWSYDRGRTWDYLNTIPLAQFYEVAFDMRRPYWVYGGLQDNGSWGSPSATPYVLGPSNDEWVNVGGGDGFYVQCDLTDWRNIYSESQQGSLGRMNLATGERKSIRPRPPFGEPPYRFDWNTPVLLSPHNPKKIYMGGNRLFISSDRGETWRRTEDLSTKPDRDKMPIMGVLPGKQTLARNDGQDSFGQIVTISESPLKAGLLYVGTDDGNLQVSRDDGKTWKNVAPNVTGVPKGTYVTRVVASNHAEGRAYATFDGHRSSDFKPYVFMTEDYGETWKPLAAALPEGGTVKAFREHPRNPSLLFVGTERGLYGSVDRGGQWLRFGAPLPTVPVCDIQIHPRDNALILATHGRGVWILDDITPWEQVAGKSLPAKPTLFTPVASVAYRTWSHKGNTGNRFYAGPNPAFGALIQYYLPTRPAAEEAVSLTILDRSGKTVVREMKALPQEAGIHRITWDMRHNAPIAGRPMTRAEEAAILGLTEDDDDAAQKDDDAAQKMDADKIDADKMDKMDTNADQDLRDGAQEAVAAENKRVYCAQEPPSGGPPSGGPPSGGQGPGNPDRPQGAGPGFRRGGQRGQGGQAPPSGGGGGFGFFGMRGARALPGTYLVRLTVGKEVQTALLTIEEDPRIALSSSERRAYFDAQIRLGSLYATANETQRVLQTVRKQLADLQQSAELAQAPTTMKEEVTALSKQVNGLLARLSLNRPTPPSGGESGGEAPPSRPDSPNSPDAPPAPTAKPLITPLLQLLLSLDSITEAPSPAVRQETDALAGDLKQIVHDVNDINEKMIPHLNTLRKDSKGAPLTPGARLAAPR